MGNDCSAPVVIIDDDTAVRESLKFLFEVAGYNVAEYASVAGFLRERILRPACMILDHHMPEMTGLALAAQLRGGGTHIPILLITGSSSPAIVVRAAELGIEKVLEKPPDEHELLAFVAAYAQASG